MSPAASHTRHPGRFIPGAAPAAFVPMPVDWAALVAERHFLVAYARRRLLDPSLAEDLVHDVFEAVVTGRARFGGQSALRGWLLGVLKHKIVDLVRQRSGEHSLDTLEVDDGSDSPAFHHPALTCPQPRPDEVAEQRERLRQTLARLATLPATLRHAVELRLLHDGDTGPVCDALEITERNLFVRLHRARRQLVC